MQVTSPPMKAALGGRHELLHQRQVDAIEAADAQAHEEAHDGEIDPAIVGREVEQAGGDREVQHRADEHLSHGRCDLAIQPRPQAPMMAPMPRLHQHRGRLAESELPWPDQEGEHEGDQEVVEELKRVADDGGGEDLLLVSGQARLSIEYLEHGVSLRWRLVLLFAGRRASASPMLKNATPSPGPAEDRPVCPSKRARCRVQSVEHWGICIMNWTDRRTRAFVPQS